LVGPGDDRRGRGDQQRLLLTGVENRRRSPVPTLLAPPRLAIDPGGLRRSPILGRPCPLFTTAAGAPTRRPRPPRAPDLTRPAMESRRRTRSAFVGTDGKSSLCPGHAHAARIRASA
jgi:hypothetical protein